jgi:hypothetical protein
METPERVQTKHHQNPRPCWCLKYKSWNLILRAASKGFEPKALGGKRPFTVAVVIDSR